MFYLRLIKVCATYFVKETFKAFYVFVTETLKVLYASIFLFFYFL